MEIILPIKGFEEYKISDQGYIIGKTGCIMKTHYTKDGYKKVSIGSGMHRKTMLVHRLVCRTFHGDSKGKQTVNHINGIKDDNRAVNVEWSTYSENQLHAYRTGLKKTTGNNNFRKNHPRCNKGKFGSDAKNSKRVGQYTLDGNLVAIHGGLRDAGRKLGLSFASIGFCCQGRQPAYKGFIWRYLV